MTENTKELKVDLPIPPSVNHAYQTTKTGKRIRTDIAREWLAYATVLVKQAKIKQKWLYSDKEKIVVEYLVFWKDKRKRDVSNLEKLCGDVMQKIVYEDDCWTLPRFMDFSVDKENPRIELTIYRL